MAGMDRMAQEAFDLWGHGEGGLWDQSSLGGSTLSLGTCLEAGSVFKLESTCLLPRWKFGKDF